jgi:hypothetical protein
MTSTGDQLPEPLYHIDLACVRHVAAAVLAARSGYCRDYIACLARQGRIAGRQLGTHWYADERSFWSFFLDQERLREERRRQLAARRRLEYLAAQSAAARPL